MANPILQRPPWLVQRVSANAGQIGRLMEDLKLNTVCQSAHCPNLGECFGSGTATFLILGGVCTRRCTFCAIPKGATVPVDSTEADNVARAVQALKLSHVVITSVTRDDLVDGGSSQFALCIEKIRRLSPNTAVEVLTPDFQGDSTALQRVLEARPAVFNHNIETVPRLYDKVRPQADYRRSLKLLEEAAKTAVPMVKSGLMVGLGETPEEVAEVFNDLVAVGVTAVTVGQYLRPSDEYLPVIEYVHPDQFRRYEQMAMAAGLKKAACGPLVRSSYHAAAMAK